MNTSDMLMSVVAQRYPEFTSLGRDGESKFSLLILSFFGLLSTRARIQKIIKAQRKPFGASPRQTCVTSTGHGGSLCEYSA